MIIHPHSCKSHIFKTLFIRKENLFLTTSSLEQLAQVQKVYLHFFFTYYSSPTRWLCMAVKYVLEIQSRLKWLSAAVDRSINCKLVSFYLLVKA